MKKLLILTLLTMMSVGVTYAQKDTSYWSNSGLLGVYGAQSGFKNWSQGGENTLSATANILFESHYKKEKNA